MTKNTGDRHHPNYVEKFNKTALLTNVRSIGNLWIERTFVFLGRGNVGRRARQWWPNTVFHVVSRGNRKEALFHDYLDYTVFLQFMADAQKKVDYSLYAFCLMKNHFHLLISTSEQPISKVMAWLNKKYVTYYNNRYMVCGHLFEKRFYSSAVHDDYGILKVSRYIHRNPIEANLTEDPKDYRWSSYNRYLGQGDMNFPMDLNTSRVLHCIPGTGQPNETIYRDFVEKEEGITFQSKNFFILQKQ